MPGHDIMVIGTSAGGMDALKQLMRNLPANLEAAVFVVAHLSPHTKGLFVWPAVLANAGPLPAARAEEGQAIERGRVYVAPPDHHLVLENDRVRLTRAPKENRFRPAVDPLFRSAAYSFGPRVVGTVLTGNLDDGTAGLWAIKDRGGIAVVQDPLDAEYPSMPRSALQNVDTDYCVPLRDLAPLLVRLAREPVKGRDTRPISEELDVETKIAYGQNAERNGIMELGHLSPYTCPECHGTLIQMRSGGILRFRCHTGHAYSMESLLADLSQSLENTLWSSVRSLEEGALLTKHISEHLHSTGETAAAIAFERKATEVRRRAEAVREIAMQQPNLSEDMP